MDDARQERPHDGHEGEAFPRQHGSELELVGDPEDIHDCEGDNQVFGPAQQQGEAVVTEASNGKLPPRRRQELERIRVRHWPDDEDCRDADAQKKAEQGPTGGEQGDFGNGGTEGGDEDWQEAEQDAGVGHVDLVELDHVAQDAVDVGVAC